MKGTLIVLLILGSLSVFAQSHHAEESIDWEGLERGTSTLSNIKTSIETRLAFKMLEGCSYRSYMSQAKQNITNSCQEFVTDLRNLDASEAYILKAIRSGVSEAKLEIAEEQRNRPVEKPAGKSFEELMQEV